MDNTEIDYRQIRKGTTHTHIHKHIHTDGGRQKKKRGRDLERRKS